MNKTIKLHLEVIKLNFETAQAIIDGQAKIIEQIKATVDGGLKLMDETSQGFNKPYDGLDISLIHGRLLRIRELCK